MSRSVLFLSVSLSVSLCLCGSKSHAELKAGAARVSITPDPKAMPYPLGGYVSPPRLGHNATGIHDACAAPALVLSDGTTKCAVVSLALCFLPASVREAVAARLGGTGLSAALFLAATHTHSGPDPLVLHRANTGPSGALPQ